MFRHSSLAAVLAVLTAVTLWAQIDAEPTGNGVTNGDFVAWADDHPQGWTVSQGAGNGQPPFSSVEPIDEKGLRLSGDASTRTWRAVSQTVELKPGTSWVLEFEARASSILREANQFDNCFVGMFFFDANGNRVGLEAVTVAGKAWRAEVKNFTVPKKAAKCDVTIFLSKTGRLEVKRVAILPATNAPFQTLVDEMGRHYSFLALKEIDWPALTSKYRKRAEAAKEPAQFIKAVRPMLKQLEDLHVWIIDEQGKRTPTHLAAAPRNINTEALKRRVAEPKPVGRMAVVGTIDERIGYVMVKNLPNDQAVVTELLKAIDELGDAQAMIIDLRLNSGGNEEIAAQIAGRFTDASVVYAGSKVRSGPDPNDFGPTHFRTLEPAGNTPFLKPTACLIGPGCVSSGEGFAMMMKAIPHVTLLGLPTRGASGNPQPVRLPNGVQVFFSRWISLLPDETPIEGVGVPPDQLVKHVRSNTRDPTLEAAIGVLKASSPER